MAEPGPFGDDNVHDLRDARELLGAARVMPGLVDAQERRHKAEATMRARVAKGEGSCFAPRA